SPRQLRDDLPHVVADLPERAGLVDQDRQQRLGPDRLQQERAGLVLQDRPQELPLAQLAADAVGGLGETGREGTRHLVALGREIARGLDEEALPVGQHHEANSRRGRETGETVLDSLWRRGRLQGGRGRSRDHRLGGGGGRRGEPPGGSLPGAGPPRGGGVEPFSRDAEPSARMLRSRSILRTRSSTPNGLNSTPSERTSAGRARTAPLSVPALSSA